MTTKDNQPMPKITIDFGEGEKNIFGFEKETKQPDVISQKAKVGEFTPVAKEELLQDIEYLANKKPELWDQMKPLFVEIEKNRRAYNQADDDEIKQDLFKKNISNYQTLQSLVVANESLWNKT